MAEINAVGGGLEDDFVQADDVAFAEGRDLEIFCCWPLASRMTCWSAIAVPEGASFLWAWWRSKIWPE